MFRRPQIPGTLDGDPALGVDAAAETDKEVVIRDDAGRHEQASRGMTQPPCIGKWLPSGRMVKAHATHGAGSAMPGR